MWPNPALALRPNLPPVPDMIRITELRLPLNHAEDALRPAIVARLEIGRAHV